MSTKPITVFIHVPKTAGSTVNSYLERSTLPGATHIEAWVEDNQAVNGNLMDLDWVSGHVPYQVMRARLSAHTFRHLRFFTLVRDPIEQLMSHYNWLIEIYNRGGSFYDGHPEKIKEISKSIRSVDNNNPHCVIAQLEAAPGLFLNQQSRIVLGDILEPITDAEFKDRLAGYSMIATETMMPKFIETISGMNYQDSRRDNVSPYHFDKAVFETDAMKVFLEKKHAKDVKLYKYLKRNEMRDFV